MLSGMKFSLCTHLGGPKMTHSASKCRYLKVENVDDYPNRGRLQKIFEKVEIKWFLLFSKNPALILREEVKKLSKKGIKQSYYPTFGRQ